MSKRQIDIELPAKVWEIIDTQFKLNGESDSEILSKIVKNHLASNGHYPDVDSLQQGNGLKDIVDIHQDMIISIVDLFEKKGIATFQEYNEVVQERLIKNSLFTKNNK
jgi:hypothetical protein